MSLRSWIETRFRAAQHSNAVVRHLAAAPLGARAADAALAQVTYNSPSAAVPGSASAAPLHVPETPVPAPAVPVHAPSVPSVPQPPLAAGTDLSGMIEVNCADVHWKDNCFFFSVSYASFCCRSQ